MDAKGIPKQIEITPGNFHDNQCADSLIENAEAGAVIADKAYDCDNTIDLIESKGMLAVIPPKRNRVEPREYDRELYKERNLVERFFGRIKHFRGIATRYEKTAESYSALLHLACVKSCLL